MTYFNMKFSMLSIALAWVTCVSLCGCVCLCSKDAEKLYSYKIPIGLHSAVTPVNNPDEWWIQRHQAIVNRIGQGNVDLLFIGDSITACWEATAMAIWQQYYGRRYAVNMGFGGDRTQHVLWRLDHGEIAGIRPKLAVLMIGTNNTPHNSEKEIGEGIIAVCQKLRTDLPQTKILVLGILPVGEKPSLRREKNAQASMLASTIADNKYIFYMDIGSKFLNEEGLLTAEMMFDYVHLTPKGYQIMADTIEPMVIELMDEKQ